MLTRLISRRRRPVTDVSEADLYVNPYPIYRRLRAQQPVAYAPGLRHFALVPDAYWLVTRWDDVTTVLKDDDTFRSPEPPDGLPPTIGASLLYADAEQHSRYRAALQPACQPRRARAFADESVARLLDGLLDELEPRGQAELIDELFEPLAARTVAAIVGLDDVPTPDLRRWLDYLGLYFTGDSVASQAERINEEIDRELLARLGRVHGGADGSLLATVEKDRPATGLTDEEVLSNVKMFAAAGMHELADLLAHALIGLLSRPDQLTELREDPSLVKPAMEEAARWGAPVGMVPRLTAAETEIAGTRIPRHSLVAAVIASANRDERRWTDGSTFDLHRDEGMHLAFASGVHFCLGAWLVRAAGAVVLSRLVERLPAVRLTPGDQLLVTGWRFRDVRRLPATWA
jgi:cytochrome P450